MPPWEGLHITDRMLSDMYLVVQVPEPPWEVVTRMEGLPIKNRMLSEMYLVVQIPGAALGDGHQDGGAPHKEQDAL